MVSSPRQFPGIEGKICNYFLPSKEDGPHCLCVACRGKSCMIANLCGKCLDRNGDRCRRVSDYMHKFSLQWEKKRERKAKASSSSFLSFSPLMLVPLWQLLSSAGAGVVTTTPLSTAFAVTFLAAAPFVSPVGVT